MITNLLNSTLHFGSEELYGLSEKTVYEIKIMNDEEGKKKLYALHIFGGKKIITEYDNFKVVKGLFIESKYHHIESDNIHKISVKSFKDFTEDHRDAVLMDGICYDRFLINGVIVITIYGKKEKIVEAWVEGFYDKNFTKEF